MRSRGYCKTCMKYVVDDELVRCRNSKHDLKAHERDYEDWLPEEKMKESQQKRQAIIDKYGHVPESFDLTKPRNTRLDKWIDDLAAGTYPIYGWGTRTGALAQAPANQVKQDILMYSEKGERIFNPMMERAQHLLIANYYGRHSLGQDICKKFFDHDVQKIKQKILSSEKLFPKNNTVLEENSDKFMGKLQGCVVELHLGDSRDISWLPDETVHFVITSPPYYKCASYGPEKEQIGTGSSKYDEFLDKLRDIFSECFRVLKKGRFMSVQVNDFRMGKFFVYHRDTIQLMEDVGFIPHDIRVYQVGTLSSIFASQLEEQKRSAKTHEYIMIFKKPESVSLEKFKVKKALKKIADAADMSIVEDEEEEEKERVIKHIDRDTLSKEGTGLNYFKKKV